jgi:lipopolysaccharide export system protein LptA
MIMAAPRKLLLAVAALLIVPGAALHAQPAKVPAKPQAKAQAAPAAQPSGPPNALQGFSQNRDEPVHIEAATLEVHDKQKEATFSGDVHVIQGDTDLRCKKLVVFYEQQVEGADKSGTKSTNTANNTGSTGSTNKASNMNNSVPAADPGPGGQQRIKRLEAYGNVVVTQKDQTATGEVGIYDLKTSTVTLTGNVLMTQGKNVLRGERLWVDLATGVSRVEPGKNGHGRVEGLFLPNSGPPGTPGSAPGTPGSAPATPGGAPAATSPAAKPAAKPAETARSSQPMQLQPPH